MNTKLISTAAAILSVAAGSALAAADGADYKFTPAQASTVTRAELKAEAVQANQESQRVFPDPEGEVATAALTPAAVTRSRADVKAEAVEKVRVTHPGVVKTPD